ncbi:hypothetical protein JDV02_006631 [Purpureocillium takamizusanense]|uniref:Uncharacterized protein n=1 Tax=Purpureocillium takamizusanense TaxID=2060973 RepID=A0A9Q8VCB6_9HYPO|nr:uncharacterized protein JDV02_006631 [Purpureocillium takamizusanense]UNI20553.1 hypothetical protein JDV02_006631 [Purpureocillium takamizusanense]
MASTEQLFLALLRSEAIQSAIARALSTPDLCALRASSSACCNLVTRRLFARLHVTFSASSFTRPCRLEALSRVGRHVEHLTFYMPHSDATFLPPLVHPATGREMCFLYSPHTSMGSALARPKYANTELAEILTQQYPPLFHAATNVPSFINALAMLPNLRHLTIRCPGQDPAERYRRDVVDYALISLRIAVERCPLHKLAKLSLSSVHPAAFNYLRHVSGIGCVPSAARRWRQIRKLHLSVEAWDFYGPSPGLDHLKIIDDYVRFFAPWLEKFAFSWVGAAGPCPIALSGDPLFAPPRASKKLFHEVTSPMSPLPTRPSRAPIHFPVLRYLQVRNARVNAPQLSGLINAHTATVREFDFENVVLDRKDSWDDALAPVMGDDSWARTSSSQPPRPPPLGGGGLSAETSVISDDGDDELLPSPSAAVAAASRELLDIELGCFVGFPGQEEERVAAEPLVLSEQLSVAQDDDTMSFTTTIKKKRSRRRRRKHHHSHKEADGPAAPERRPSTSSSASSSSPSSSPSSTPSRRRRPSLPKLKSSLESIQQSLRRPFTPSPPPSPKESTISAPILAADPRPVLLQPRVYDPSSPAAAAALVDDGISSVQRDMEKEEAHRLLAEDASARASALQRAKEAVLAKLSREFCASASKQQRSHHHRRAGGGGGPADAVAACRLLAGRELGWCGSEVLEDRSACESRSALVPLMFSRT